MGSQDFYLLPSYVSPCSVIQTRADDAAEMNSSSLVPPSFVFLPFDLREGEEEEEILTTEYQRRKYYT